MNKKKSKFADAPPVGSYINEANALIEELWEQFRHYEDKLKTSSSNSSKPPSSDGPKERAERKKRTRPMIPRGVLVSMREVPGKT
ncbi:DUF6444 domain-containing protein [Vibrio diabolicus]